MKYDFQASQNENQDFKQKVAVLEEQYQNQEAQWQQTNENQKTQFASMQDQVNQSLNELKVNEITMKKGVMHDNYEIYRVFIMRL